MFPVMEYFLRRCSQYVFILISSNLKSFERLQIHPGYPKVSPSERGLCKYDLRYLTVQHGNQRTIASRNGPKT